MAPDGPDIQFSLRGGATRPPNFFTAAPIPHPQFAVACRLDKIAIRKRILINGIAMHDVPLEGNENWLGGNQAKQ